MKSTDLISFEQLPDDLIAEIFYYFSATDFKELSTVSRYMRTIAIQTWNARILLNVVNAADYQTAIRMLKKTNPSNIFQKIKWQHGDKTSIRSPLSLAFYYLDSHMQNIFLERIKNIPELVKEFYNTALEVNDENDFICIDELYEAYSTFQKLLKEQSQKDPLVKLTLLRQFLQIGLMQRNILPRHMLKEMCNVFSHWNPNHNFEISHGSYPLDCEYYNRQLAQSDNVLPFVNGRGLGFSYTLCRGNKKVATGFIPGYLPSSEQLEYDYSTFKQLHITRKKDVARLIDNLKKQVETSVKYQFDIISDTLSNVNASSIKIIEKILRSASDQKLLISKEIVAAEILLLSLIQGKRNYFMEILQLIRQETNVQLSLNQIRDHHNGEYLIHIAIKQAYDDILTLLLQEPDANPNQLFPKSSNVILQPILYALNSGNEKIALILIKHPKFTADQALLENIINIATPKNFTQIIEKAFEIANKYKIIIDLNGYRCQGIDGGLLKFVIKNQNKTLFKLFLEKGIDPNSTRKIISHPILCALDLTQDSYFTHALFNHRKFDFKTIYHDGNTLLHIAFLKKNISLIYMCMSSSIPLNHVNDAGMTALEVAASNGMTALAIRLIQKGADIRTEFAMQPIIAVKLATKNGHVMTAAEITKAYKEQQQKKLDEIHEKMNEQWVIQEQFKYDSK